MIIGIPKEIKNEEYRVGLTPFSAHELVTHGHTVLVEKDAGLGIGFTDADYEAAGVTVMSSACLLYTSDAADE